MVHASTCVPKHNLLRKPHSYNLTSFQIYKIRYLRPRVWNVPDIPFYDGNLWLLHEELVHYFQCRFFPRLPLLSYVNYTPHRPLTHSLPNVTHWLATRWFEHRPRLFVGVHLSMSLTLQYAPSTHLR